MNAENETTEEGLAIEIEALLYGAYAAAISEYEAKVSERLGAFKRRLQFSRDKSITDLWLTGKFGSLGPNEIQDVVRQLHAQ